MEKEPIVPDEFFRINIAEAEKTGAPDHVMVNAKYDRIDYFTRFGQFVIKVYDDEYGLMCLYVNEETANRVHEFAGLPIVPRDQILQSEYEGYISAQASRIDDSWLD